MAEYGADIQRLNTEHQEFRRRLDKLESNDERHEEDIRELYKAQEGTKVYVTQILASIQQLETKLFGLVTNLTQQNEKERNAERKERSSATNRWLNFSKYVIGATIGVIILYIFQQGGK